MRGPVIWDGNNARLLPTGTLLKADGTPVSGAASGIENAYKIVQPDVGTSPTAVGEDTLTLTSSDGSVEVNGNSGTDTIDFKKAGKVQPTGSYAAPTALANGATISPAAKPRQILYVVGDGGATTLSASGIAAGAYDGQELFVCGTDDTNTVTISDGGNTAQGGGDSVLGAGSIAHFLWDATGAIWRLIGRNYV